MTRLISWDTSSESASQIERIFKANNDTKDIQTNETDHRVKNYGINKRDYSSAVVQTTVQSFKILGAKNSGYKNKRKHTHMHRQVYIHLHTHPWPNSFVCGWLTQGAVKISCLDRDGWDKYGDTEYSKIKRANSMEIETSFQKIRQDHGRNMLPNNEQHWRFKTTKAFVHYLALFTNRVEETL